MFLKFPYLSIFIVLIIFYSCKDKPAEPNFIGPTTAQGQIIDATTGKSVALATAILTRNKRGSSSSLSRETVKTQYTGEDGSFSFSFTPEEGYNYQVEAEAKYYYISGTDGAAFLKNNALNENLLVKIKPKGYIKFIVVNDEPKEMVNRFNIANEVTVNQFEKDTIIYKESLGSQNIGIGWWITLKTGEIRHFTENIFVKALDTTEYIIKY
ncbi:MAG: hypothetical protein EOP53_08015 [Sphingobacteriales bacterium]|nr:MAG: hypothetical protein EOP53_08015 [Sphingobacteriales bacterium]